EAELVGDEARLDHLRLEGLLGARVPEAQLDGDAARVGEADERLDLAGVGLGRAALHDREARGLEAATQALEGLAALDLPTVVAEVVDGALAAVRLDEEARRARVHARREAAVAAAMDDLRPEDARHEVLPRLEIRDAEAD